MDTVAKDILLVKTGSGSSVIVEAPGHTVYPGALVAYDGGKYGIVQQRAWIGVEHAVIDILSAITPVYELEEAFTSTWKRKETENVSGTP